MPTRTFPALHGWRRCGKRSAAPRATPQNTILSENRWFSRCSGCSRRRRGRPSANYQSRPFWLRLKGIRGGDAWEKDRQKTKSEEGSQAIAHRQRQGDGEKTRKARGEEGREGEEDGCEEGRQNIVNDIGDEVKTGRPQSGPEST